jgi:hypothetical protein
MNINVETGWKIWAREPSIFVYTPPCCTPFQLYLVLYNNIKISLMKILGLKDGPVSRVSHEKVGFGDSWGDGADFAQKVDTLAGR